MDPKLFQEIECEERLPDLTDEELAELENSFDEFDRLALREERAEAKRLLDELDRLEEELEELDRLEEELEKLERLLD